MAKRSKQLPEARSAIVPDAAGIDIGGETHFAAVPKDRAERPVRSFGSFTADLNALAAWFRECRIKTVVVESTGVFWMPVCDHLEAAGFEVLLVDPRTLTRHLRKKSDVTDCQFLQELLAAGLLKGCFRPPAQVRALRTLWRHRAHLVVESARLLQMMQKTLVQMNVHLQLVVADVAGETGMRILRAIVKGCRDPRKLAAFRNYRCRRSEAEIAKALDGVWDDAHLFELKQLLQAWDFQRRQLAACDRRFEKECSAMPDRSDGQPPPESKAQRRGRSEPALDGRGLVFRMTGVDLCAIDGLGANTALAVLAETGPDVSRFPTDKHFASWTGLAPRRDQSGKRKRTPSPPASGANRVANAFRLAAQSLIKSQTVLGCFLRRMKARLGPGPAIRATACKLAKLFWRLLAKRERYRREDVAAYEAGFQERRKRWLARQAAALGLALTPVFAPPT